MGLEFKLFFPKGRLMVAAAVMDPISDWQPSFVEKVQSIDLAAPASKIALSLTKALTNLSGHVNLQHAVMPSAMVVVFDSVASAGCAEVSGAFLYEADVKMEALEYFKLFRRPSEA